MAAGTGALHSAAIKLREPGLANQCALQAPVNWTAPVIALLVIPDVAKIVTVKA